MSSFDGLRRFAAAVSIVSIIAPMGGTAQEDQRATTPQTTVPGPGSAGRVRKEGTSITVDHAMKTSLPEPGRDNAFSMTVSKYGITATLQTLASEAGSAILERGGNVVDAIIAANAAVGVIEPSMNGVGGDLFALYWDNKAKKLYALNASGWAPAGWSLENLKAHNVTRLRGIWSVTVPGTVAGWEDLHERFGKLSLAEDLKPAEALAEKGFPVSEANSVEWEKYGFRLRTAGVRESLLPNGSFVHVGQVFKNPGHRQYAAHDR